MSHFISFQSRPIASDPVLGAGAVFPGVFADRVCNVSPGVRFVYVCFRGFDRLLGDFWPPAQQTEIKLRFGSVRGQSLSLWSR